MAFDYNIQDPEEQKKALVRRLMGGRTAGPSGLRRPPISRWPGSRWQGGPALMGALRALGRGPTSEGFRGFASGAPFAPSPGGFSMADNPTDIMFNASYNPPTPRNLSPSFDPGQPQAPPPQGAGLPPWAAAAMGNIYGGPSGGLARPYDPYINRLSRYGFSEY